MTGVNVIKTTLFNFLIETILKLGVCSGECAQEIVVMRVKVVVCKNNAPCTWSEQFCKASF